MKDRHPQQATFFFLMIGFCSLLGVPVFAAPWINPDNLTTRVYINLLADSGMLDLNTNTWPIAWASLDREICKVDTQQLGSDSQRQAYRYLSAELERQKQNETLVEAGLKVSNESPFLNGFGDTQREANEAWLSLDTRGNHWAAGLKLNALEGNYSDDPHGRLDGSYLVGLAGNWAIGAGAIERWWGPGWGNALTLSTHAHPPAGLFLRRLADDAPNNRWFSWMGPISFEMFISQLEKERHISGAKLLGTRFSFRPVKGFEIGLFRNAQWGGEGRPESFSSLVDMVLGKDNFSSEDEGKSDEPGNQLAGLDVRFGLHRWGLPAAFYMQMAGEDEANAFPSKRFWLTGLDTTFNLQGNTLMAWLEYTDTTVGGFEDTPKYNITYNHSIYQSGYRHKGRAIGSSFDGDSKVIALGGLLQTKSSGQFGGTFKWLDLNQDGGLSAAPPGGEFYQADTWALEGYYQNTWGELLYKVGASVFGDEIANQLADSGDYRVFVEVSYRFF